MPTLMLLARHGWDIHAIRARSERASLVTLVRQERRNTKDQALSVRHPAAHDQLQLNGIAYGPVVVPIPRSASKDQDQAPRTLR
jgi:hypothetical protein